MKIETIDNSDERTILIGMIVNKTVLGRIAIRYERDMFSSKWANLISSWCVKYYRRYNKAPLTHIQSLYSDWVKDSRNEKLKDIVGEFLQSISKQYSRLEKDSNPDYIIDLAGKYLNRLKLERLIELTEADLTNNDTDKAITSIANFHHLELGVGEGINVLTDKEAIQACFEEEHLSLIQYHQGLGKFFGDRLERDGFIAFMGKDKIGKCVSEDMEIPLSNGKIKTIKQIVKSKKDKWIVSINPKTQKFEKDKIVEYFDNGKKECFEITTKTGRKVSTTFNHQYLTPNGWVYLENLKEGDFIAVPKIISCFGNKKMKNSEVEFLAFMLAEGGCTNWQANFTNIDKRINERFENCCNDLGIEYRVKGISHYLLGVGNLRRKYKKALWKVKSTNKEIPDCIFELPKEQISLFLKIFFSCDGSIWKTKGDKHRIGLSLSNERMLLQISHLLNRFGIVHKIYNRKVKYEKNGKEFPCWGVSIMSEEYVDLFLKEINFISYKKTRPFKVKYKRSYLDNFPPDIAKQIYEELKQEWEKEGFYKKLGRTLAQQIRVQINRGKTISRQSLRKAKGTKVYDKYINSEIIWDKIEKIKSVGLKQTYDIAVLRNHNFIANDCIVHNSFWLQDMAFRAALQRRKVAFFECGDSSQNQIMRRFMARIAKHPIRPDKVHYPVSLEVDDEGTPQVEHTIKNFTEKLNWKKAYKACKNLIETKGCEANWRLSCHHNDTLKIEGLMGVLDVWEKDNWTPDVIIIDYVDILDMNYSGLEGRDRINKVWKQLRRLSQDRHCLVVTATQSDAAAYDVKTISKKHFSEDKRKHAHVTGMVGLNQTDKEKKLGVMRLNWIDLREGYYSESHCCYVATCMPLANIAVRSVF